MSRAPDTSSASLRQALAGLLLLAGLALQVARFMVPAISASWVSYACWLAVALLWMDIPRRTRLQAGCLAAIGVALLLAARLQHDADIAWPRILEGNVYVVAMLLGVSFIGLIGNQRGRTRPLGRAVTGLRGSAGTWLGVHLLGSILNLSTVFMVGDRLARRGPLSAPQLLALNRGLSSAALWSPFFASMGVVMTLAPQMHFTTVLAFGMPLALLSGLIGTLELSRRYPLDEVAGFSLSPRSLAVPALLAALVMLFHYVITPRLTIVSIITFLLPAVALCANLPQGPRWLLGRVRQHSLERLPAMRGEVSLFLCAGLLTLGLSTYIDAATGSEWTLFETFGVSQAMLSFLAIVASSVAGLHPIIGVSVLASMLDLPGERQTLFACVALASWAVGTSVGPLSGINLSLQGRYGVSGGRMMRDNLVYASAMTVAVVLALVLLNAWR
ncbi:hypothetical protein [Halomonas urumqiensis]|uniref:Permease n=1 Tax=Halomonas urumqiensis TaxID=1684789 RepID=A0A2N7UFM5_9GAMM|nr:hypothetical protein [Halomonas urumqiensis]PMR79247.1 hypothetical protein C1H70_13215 [Halomonas urumqiensis]PTB03920.1 hypothetical protein C6V82_05500 [Halomonas urumqiensis]GHE19832.1 hypothetical protein GCM10017767_03530 [Halomonas urumqiensis]